MRFIDWKNETAQLQTRQALMNAVSDRTYVLRREDDPHEKVIDMSDPAMTRMVPRQIEHRIHVTVRWNECYVDNPRVEIVLDRDRWGTVTHALGWLTPNELGYVATVRALVDRWITGEISDLATIMPWEETLPPKRNN